MITPPVAPRATYRLQLSADFTLFDAAEQVPYLRELGVSHLYLSPVLRARRGSTHGYDVVDPTAVDPERGGEEGFAALLEVCRHHGLGLVLDIVPNHMAADIDDNAWWADVLRLGPNSPHAGFFDIDWDPPEARLQGQVLLPILPDQFGRVLERGELTVRRDRGRFVVAFADHLLPLDPKTVVGAGGSDESTVDAWLDRTNQDPDALQALLDAQHYRLAHWRLGGEELDYRRFFDIDHLVGVCVDDPAVFARTHERVLDWVDRRVVEGLRIDHIDGLADPVDYLYRLRERTPGCWIVVEKILERDEELRAEWPVDGTTGYEFAAAAGGLFVDPAGEAELTRIMQHFVGDTTAGTEVVGTAKADVLDRMLRAEVTVLTDALVDVCDRRRRVRDFSRRELAAVVRAFLVAFPTYRTYVRGDGPAGPEDRAVIEAAAAGVAADPTIDGELVAVVASVLCSDPPEDGPAEFAFRDRFQQTTPPVMAKAKEDTALYRYFPLLATNDVGADPERFGTTVRAFHDHGARTQRLWPATMTSLSTHDSKRSEDVRARLAVLAEIPALWEQTVQDWFEALTPHRERFGIDRATEFYLYQTLVGAFPLSTDRAVEHLRKARREAKDHTSWLDPDPTYETRLEGFIRAALADAGFRLRLESFARVVTAAGRVNALAQKLLHLTAPGVPDIYQGNELWDLSLVDPDNRRPIDWSSRRELLTRLRSGHDLHVDLADPWDEGAAKLLLTERALAVRRRFPVAFGANGTYEPQWATGSRAEHVVAYLRGGEVLVAVPRLLLGIGPDWEGTSLPLPPGRWHDELTVGRTFTGSVTLDELLGPFPVALLVRADQGPAAEGPEDRTLDATGERDASA